MGSASDGDRPWQSYHTVYTNAKAGMDGVDKEKVQKVIYEMSKGSKYFESEKRKEEFIKHKIENLQAQCAKLTDKDISHFQQGVLVIRIEECECCKEALQLTKYHFIEAFGVAVTSSSKAAFQHLLSQLTHLLTILQSYS